MGSNEEEYLRLSRPEMGCSTGQGRYVVSQLVEALRNKPQGRELDSQWCHWNFSLT
jgi:hypothetical protein